MVKLKAENFVTNKINDVEQICLDQCITNITSKPNTSQEICMEACMKKVVSALDLLTRLEKVGGFERSE